MNAANRRGYSFHRDAFRLSSVPGTRKHSFLRHKWHRGQLYVSTPNSILHFINAENISGNVAPASVISCPDTLLSVPQHIFLDTADDRLTSRAEMQTGSV
jgi:hypothetical protein